MTGLGAMSVDRGRLRASALLFRIYLNLGGLFRLRAFVLTVLALAALAFLDVEALKAAAVGLIIYASMFSGLTCRTAQRICLFLIVYALAVWIRLAPSPMQVRDVTNSLLTNRLQTSMRCIGTTACGDRAAPRATTATATCTA